MITLKIAAGNSERSKKVTNISIDWPTLLKRIAEPHIQPEARSYIMAGQCEGEIRGNKAVKATSIALIDIDDKAGTSGLDLIDLTDYLELAFPYLWALYTTRSYNGENVCCRLVVPFKKSVPEERHGDIVKSLVRNLPQEWQELVDGVSYLANQIMFLPCVAKDGDPFENFSGGNKPFDPDGLSVDGAGESNSSNLGDLGELVASKPANYSDEEVDSFLDAIDPNNLSYGLDDGTFGWANVIAAIAHQYQGGAIGLKKAKAWSERNKEKYQAATTTRKYNSFKSSLGNGRDPITMRSVSLYVKSRLGVNDSDLAVLEGLLKDARAISDLKAYVSFRDQVRAIPKTVLPDDARALIAASIASTFGKSEGITKTEIKKAISLTHKQIPDIDEDRITPQWMEGWCYIEKTREFYQVATNHGILKEAFDARFDRERECRELEIHASTLSLVHLNMKTVADYMYWPGADKIFTREGNTYINTYDDRRTDIRPPKSDEDAGKIFFIEDHFKNLVSNKEDRAILLDWLSYIYRNPGKRVNWAVLLQGGEGIGKSFISSMMTNLIGPGNSTVLSASTISGNFTDWAIGSILCTVEEIRVSGASRYEILDRLKPYLTNDEISIEEKYRRPRVVPNFTNYLFLSNHKDAIPLTEENRRYAVIYSDLQSKHDATRLIGDKESQGRYFDRLFTIIREDADLIGHWLMTRPISESFNPKDRAPITSSYEELMALSDNSVDELLFDAVDIFKCDVINELFIDITYLSQMARLEGFEIPKSNTLKSSLLKAGYSPINGRRVIISSLGRCHTIWYRKGKIREVTIRNKLKEFFKDGPPEEVDQDIF